MAIIRVPNCGSVGVVQDLSQHELPINAWTDAKNIRFLDGYCNQFLGHSRVYGTPSVIPYHVLPVIVGDDRYWLYASDKKIYATSIIASVLTHTNLTRQSAGVDVDYSALPNQWTSTVIGGIPILNAGNVADYPLQWDLNIANRAKNLDNWPANTYCKAMRPFRSFLVALNITKSTTNYPYMVKWSHPAVPGSVPSSWDETDPTLDAGEFDLADGYDHVIDGLQLRDSLMVYKQNSVWRMDYTGGAFVQRVSKVLGMSGAMNRNCIAEIDGFHIVLTNNDIVIHDGMQASSILDKRTRRWLFQNINVEFNDRCFVFKNTFFNEVFFCFPTIGASIPDSAIVYNYVDKTISKRDLPNVHHAASGQISDGLSSPWDVDLADWDSDLTFWNTPDFVTNVSRVIMGSADTKLYALDSYQTFDGVPPQSYLERSGLSFDASERNKLITGIRPRITGNNGETVLIKIGGNDTDPYAAPTYNETMTHVIGTTVRNNCLNSNRYHAIRFENGTAMQWRLDSYDLEIEDNGEW